MNIPSIPTRAWKIAADNGIETAAALEALEALVERGDVERSEGTRIEGGGFYFCRKALEK